MLTLKHLSIPELIAAAGGDPWKLNDTIQAGSPGEISELATSFRSAGLCITETDEEFNQAKKRFDAAWDRDDPAHPINDAEEVRRATKWLPLGKEQMAEVAADLQTSRRHSPRASAAATSPSGFSRAHCSASTT